MPRIETVVTDYNASVDAMKQHAGLKPDVLETQTHAAKMRMAPISYSLDAAWQQRVQSFRDAVVNDPTRGRNEGPDKALLKTLDAIRETKIESRLADWLVEADPFKERSDPNAIAERGGKLLDALRESFEIAGNRADTLQLQPDILALTDVVRTRMSRMMDGVRPDSPAVSVPHQMYLELQGAISQPVDAVRARVRAEAERRGDDPGEAESDWDDGVREVTSRIARGAAGNPVFVWEVAVEKNLPKSNSNLYGNEFVFTEIFKRRDFRQQVVDFYTELQTRPQADDYAMRVREKAWPVQETIKLYLDSMAQKWGGAPEIRTTLEQTLSAVAGRVLKEVNFVATTKLARAG
ncbi:MAG: hypothetical protein U1E45_11745 [Geminicoccaceae bacterium]